MDQFFERVRDQSSLADKHGISIVSSAYYLAHLNTILRIKKRRSIDCNLKLNNEVQRQGATMNLLREYQANMAKFRS